MLTSFAWRRRILCLYAGLLFSAGADGQTVLNTFVPSVPVLSEVDNRRLEALRRDTGVDLRYTVSTGFSDDSEKLRIYSGEPVDILWLANTNNQQEFQQEKLIVPLDELAVRAGVDLDKIFGKYLRRIEGKVWFLPNQMSMQVVFYNKKIFDDAKVPYPKAGWTWDDYLTTARKLTNPKAGIYGSLMPNFDFYMYYAAHQRGVSDFRVDGKSNFGHHAFKSALQWFGDLGNKYKVQPTWQETATGDAHWNSMMEGRYAMTFIGSWHLGLFSDRINYPRDWKFGVAAPPVFPDGRNALVAGGGFAISRNCTNPEAAFRAVLWLATKTYLYNGEIPALADLTRNSFLKTFQPICETLFRNEITAEMLYQATLGNGLGVVPEKITGPLGAALNKLYMAEGEKYLLGWNDLDTTMAAIERKANELAAKTDRTRY